jgi:hypothetical protein
LLAPDAWYVPLLLGQSGVATGMRAAGRPLALYAVQRAAPELVVDATEPEHAAGQALGGLVLVGYDLSAGPGDHLAVPGGRLHVTLYWRVAGPVRGQIVTALGDTTLEAHSLGLGNLARYTREIRPARDGIVVEDYWVVVPAIVLPGEYPLTISLHPLPVDAAAAAVEVPILTLPSTVVIQEDVP